MNASYDTSKLKILSSTFQVILHINTGQTVEFATRPKSSLFRVVAFQELSEVASAESLARIVN